MEIASVRSKFRSEKVATPRVNGIFLRTRFASDADTARGTSPAPTDVRAAVCTNRRRVISRTGMAYGFMGMVKRRERGRMMQQQHRKRYANFEGSAREFHGNIIRIPAKKSWRFPFLRAAMPVRAIGKPSRSTPIHTHAPQLCADYVPALNSTSTRAIPAFLFRITAAYSILRLGFGHIHA